MIERRLMRLLGLSTAETALLTACARANLGTRAYGVRVCAFVVATAPLIRRIVPRRLLRRAVRPFVYGLIPGPAENLLYAGVWSGSQRQADGD